MNDYVVFFHELYLCLKILFLTFVYFLKIVRMNIKIMCEFVVLSAMEIHLRCTWSVNLCVVVLCVVFYNVIQNSIKMSDLLDIDGSVLEGVSIRIILLV